jgi:sec-independent protein translocase protein TatA
MDVDRTWARRSGGTLFVPYPRSNPMPFGIGPLELIIVLVIALVVFGPKRLPDLGRSLGTGMREFKDSITGKDDDDKTLAAAADEPRASSKAATSEQHDDAISRPRG